MFSCYTMPSMSKEEEFHRLRQSLIRFLNKYNELVKKPMDYGTGHLLYPSEMHALEVIGKNPGINVTGIAKALGVTKGAVSQTIKKLAGKGLIKRVRDEKDEKAVLLILDKQGRTALGCHDRFHERYDAEVKRMFERMSPEQISLVSEVFQMLEESVDSYLKSLA